MTDMERRRKRSTTKTIGLSFWDIYTLQLMGILSIEDVYKKQELILAQKYYERGANLVKRLNAHLEENGFEAIDVNGNAKQPKIYFGFAIADSMFSNDCIIVRENISLEEAKGTLKSAKEKGWLIPCLNPSHKPTIDAMGKFDIQVEIPETAPKVQLEAGDTLIVMSVRGLPRLDATRHEYTTEEIASATFTFSKYTIPGGKVEMPQLI